MARAAKYDESVAEDQRGRARSVAADQGRDRSQEALNARLMGLSLSAIAERMGVSNQAVDNMINRALDRAENRAVTELRALENARLDRLQAAIWSDALTGDLKAIGAFLRISAERSKINGLYAPTQVQMSIAIRKDMDDALNQLSALVLRESAAPQALRDNGADEDTPYDPDGGVYAITELPASR